MSNRIGNVELKNPFLLAPLAGITDMSMRCLCKEQGAALVYSEMVSAKGLYYKSPGTERLLTIGEQEKPVAYQIFGSEPEMIAFASRKLDERENVILDINMGCPVPKVVKNGEGAALLKKPELIYDIVKAAVDNTQKPVTAKIRMGWNDAEGGLEAAFAIEAAGGAAVTIHGRTREQYYKGRADWEIIKKIKEQIKIPVIGNGDVFSGEDAIKMMETTGCDMVMIARGALGNPWIFAEAVAIWEGRERPLRPGIKEKKGMMIRHLDKLLVEKGEHVAVREMRKHIGWYIKGERGASEIRKKINEIASANELRKTLENLR